MRCSHFLNFHFVSIQKGDTAIQPPLALTADAAGRGYRSFLWMWSVIGMTVFELMAVVTRRLRWPDYYLRHPLSDGILSLNDFIFIWLYLLTLSAHCQSPFLPVFQCFREGAYPFVTTHIVTIGFRFAGPVFRRYLLNGQIDQDDTWPKDVLVCDLIFHHILLL